MLEELQGEQVDVTADLAADPTSLDELAVRRMLIRLQQLEAEANQVHAVGQAVAATYAERVQALRAQATDIRANVQRYIEHVRGGDKVVYPDVGTAYLTKRKPRLYVSNQAEVEDWAGDKFYKRTLDTQAVLAYADGQAQASGELLPGIGRQPATTTLAVRSA